MKYVFIYTKNKEGDRIKKKICIMPERCKCERKRNYTIVKRNKLNVL